MNSFMASLVFTHPRLWLALGVAALLTACASPITTRVTSFNQWPADMAGSTFSYITPMDTTRQLEQATYEGYVQAELEKRGLKRAPQARPGACRSTWPPAAAAKKKPGCSRSTRTTWCLCRPTAMPRGASMAAAGCPTLSGRAMWATGP
jgi:hypothetical protein